MRDEAAPGLGKLLQFGARVDFIMKELLRLLSSSSGTAAVAILNALISLLQNVSSAGAKPKADSLVNIKNALFESSKYSPPLFLFFDYLSVFLYHFSSLSSPSPLINSAPDEAVRYAIARTMGEVYPHLDPEVQTSTVDKLCSAEASTGWQTVQTYALSLGSIVEVYPSAFSAQILQAILSSLRHQNPPVQMSAVRASGKIVSKYLEINSTFSLLSLLFLLPCFSRSSSPSLPPRSLS